MLLVGERERSEANELIKSLFGDYLNALEVVSSFCRNYKLESLLKKADNIGNKINSVAKYFENTIEYSVPELLKEVINRENKDEGELSIIEKKMINPEKRFIVDLLFEACVEAKKRNLPQKDEIVEYTKGFFKDNLDFSDTLKDLNSDKKPLSRSTSRYLEKFARNDSCFIVLENALVAAKSHAKKFTQEGKEDYIELKIYQDIVDDANNIHLKDISNITNRLEAFIARGLGSKNKKYPTNNAEMVLEIINRVEEFTGSNMNIHRDSLEKGVVNENWISVRF